MIVSKILQLKEYWQKILAMIGYVALNAITLVAAFVIDYLVNKEKTSSVSDGVTQVIPTPVEAEGENDVKVDNEAINEDFSDSKGTEQGYQFAVDHEVSPFRAEELKQAKDTALDDFEKAKTDLSKSLEELKLLRVENDKLFSLNMAALNKYQEENNSENLNKYNNSSNFFSGSSAEIRNKVYIIIPLIDSYKQALKAVDEACDAESFANFDGYDGSNYNDDEAWKCLKKQQKKLQSYEITKNNMEELQEIVTIAEEVVQVHIRMHLGNPLDNGKQEALHRIKKVRKERDKLIDEIFTSVSS